VQHNEAPLDTWLPLEYELNQTYGIPETAPFPPLAALREQARLLINIAHPKFRDQLWEAYYERYGKEDQ